jgi:hypothetical protein
MDIQVGDTLKLKKNHPCGSNLFKVLRVGMDFRLKCNGCGREMIISRSRAEKSTKAVLRNP